VVFPQIRCTSLSNSFSRFCGWQYSELVTFKIARIAACSTPFSRQPLAKDIKKR